MHNEEEQRKEVRTYNTWEHFTGSSEQSSFFDFFRKILMKLQIIFIFDTSGLKSANEIFGPSGGGGVISVPGSANGNLLWQVKNNWISTIFYG